MNKFLIFFLVVFLSIQVNAQESNKTTYYLIRHAEKLRTDKTNRNPELAEKGINRAENWNTVFKNVKFDFVYATNYNRTIQTATPTAKNNKLEVKKYDPRDLYNNNFKSVTKGKTVLIVGHSNTTPLFVNKIIGFDKYPAIDDHNNSNLYIITIIEDTISDVLLKINHN